MGNYLEPSSENEIRHIHTKEPSYSNCAGQSQLGSSFRSHFWKRQSRVVKLVFPCPKLGNTTFSSSQDSRRISLGGEGDIIVPKMAWNSPQKNNKIWNSSLEFWSKPQQQLRLADRKKGSIWLGKTQRQL